jgi:hypothetical protein
VTLAARVPVPPLDEERLARIERAVVAGAAAALVRSGPRARWRRALAAVGAAGLAAAGLALGWGLRGAREPAASVMAEPGGAAPLAVHTGPQGGTLELGDAIIASAPGASFVVTRPAGGVRVALARGAIALEVPERRSRAPLVVAAGATEVVVVGTRFRVDYGDGTREAAVEVTEGVVRVLHRPRADARATEVAVAAGQAWTAAGGVVARGALSGPLAGGGDPARAALGAAPARRGAPGGSEATGRDRAPPPGAPRVGGVGSGASAGGSRRATLDDPRDPAFELRAALRSQVVVPALDVGERDPLAQLARYRELMTRDKGATEARAFYSMAVVQALTLGRADAALATLAAFERRAPVSDLVVPALWLEVRIRCLRALDATCREAAERYLRRAPDGPARRVAERVAALKERLH